MARAAVPLPPRLGPVRLAVDARVERVEKLFVGAHLEPHLYTDIEDERGYKAMGRNELSYENSYSVDEP